MNSAFMAAPFCRLAPSPTFGTFANLATFAISLTPPSSFWTTRLRSVRISGCTVFGKFFIRNFQKMTSMQSWTFGTLNSEVLGFFRTGAPDVLRFRFLWFWGVGFWDPGFKNSGFWGFEVLRFWGFEVLRFWGFGVLGFKVWAPCSRPSSFGPHVRLPLHHSREGEGHCGELRIDTLRHHGRRVPPPPLQRPRRPKREPPEPTTLERKRKPTRDMKRAKYHSCLNRGGIFVNHPKWSGGCRHSAHSFTFVNPRSFTWWWWLFLPINVWVSKIWRAHEPKDIYLHTHRHTREYTYKHNRYCSHV